MRPDDSLAPAPLDGSTAQRGSRYLRSRPALLALLGTLLVTASVASALGLVSGAGDADGAAPLATDPVAVYGPQQFETPGGGTAYHVEQFSLTLAPDSRYRLRVENGAVGGGSRVDSATVVLNGAEIFTSSDIHAGVAEVSRVVEPRQSNTLEVSVTGPAGSYVTLTLLQEPDPSFTVFGPEQYTRTTGSPLTWVDQFELPADGGPPFRVHMLNGNEDGTDRVASGTVVLNGVEILGSNDLNQNVGSVARQVSLQAQNTVEVTLGSNPDRHITLRFTATDTVPPVLTILAPAEGAATAATEIEVSGTVEDRTAVTVEVNGSAASLSGGSFSVSVPLAAEGQNVLAIAATDAAGNRTDSTRTVIRDTEPPLLTVTSPVDGLITPDSSVVVSGTVQDLTAVTVNVNGMPLAVDSAGGFTGEVALEEGENFLTIGAEDAVGNTTSVVRLVIQGEADTDPPVLVVTEPLEDAITFEASVWVRGTVEDASPVTLTVNGAPVPVGQGGAFEHEVALTVGPNSIVVVATDAAENVTTVTRTVTRTDGEPDPDLPPDPSTVAPPLDRTTATPLHAATEFLYTGEDPIQTDVAPGAIDPVRAGVVRGRVLTRAGQPLPGASITILNHPELGQTRSRADGRFDLAVNGGGLVTLTYEKDGYLPVQRQLDVPWQDYAHVEDVSLIPLDPVATTITFSDPVQVARSSVVQDADGVRQGTMIFKQGTQASMRLPDGTTEPLGSITVRATEYTVGEEGPRTMPGPLPAAVAYTYAVELSVDEAMAAGAKSVEFSQPVSLYVENFLGFPVGLAVPVGWWDREEAAWVPAPDGRIIEILGANGGMAQIDIDGQGVAASDSALAALGMDPAERQELASLYPPGTTLWRAETTHFSPLDGNFPFGVAADAIAAIVEWLKNPGGKQSCQAFSIIECETQVLGQRIGVAGTGYGLSYRSDRTAGRTAARTLEIRVSGSELPESLIRIELVVEVAGRRFTETFPAEPDQMYTFEWDGLDAFGRPVQGSQPVTLRLGYVYPFYYALPPSTGQTFGLSCIGAPGTPWGIACIIPASLSSSVRQEETLWSEQRTMLGTWEASAQGLGGWTLDVHHYYDPISQMLYLGDGQRRSGETPYGVIGAVAGTGSFWFSGDGGPAVLARLYNPENVAVGPDGSFYIADRSNHRIRRVDPAGIITTVAGGGSSLGDGGPATSARLSNPYDVALGPDGSLYIADNGQRRIRKVDPAGIITTVAGTGTAGFSGDGGPATEAAIAAPRNIAVAPDGSIYISEYDTHRVRRVGPDGIIHTIAGTGVQGSSGDGGASAEAQLTYPQGIAVGPDGSIYVVVNGRVRRIDPSGIITTFAGTGGTGNWGDGGPATLADVSWARDVAVAPDGSVYISQDIWNRIRRVTPDGIINTVMGTGSGTYSGDGGPATRAGGVARGLGVARNGTLYLATGSQHRVRRVALPLPGFSNNDLALASEDGSELYELDATGRHLRTRDATTGATLYAFDYTPDGLLSRVTDADGLVTEIERDGAGAPTAIVAPFGQRTTIALDANGYLATVTNPANEAVTLGHTPDGLLTLMADGKGNEKHYGYDGRGRLESAEDPRGGTKTLVRADGLSDYTVTVTSGLGRATAYRTAFLSTGEEERRTTGPDGLSTTTTYGTDGGTTVAAPDGTTTYQREGADPRWGMEAPVLQQLSVTTPGGRVFDQTAVRRATLANLADPFSLQTELDSVRINGRVFTSLYEASQLRYTTTSATGRQSVTRVDSIGRVLEQSVPGIAATSYSYNAQGFLEQVAQGGRSWSYGYDSQGRLASVTDALARTDSLYYDDADRLIRQVLPNGSEILYGYDANGNLTSLTPPGRPAHGFAYDAADQDSVYAPPSLGAGGWSTEYRYDLDRQLTKVIRPDGQEIDFGYDFAGRLDTLTTPIGSYSFGYGASTGQLTSVSAPGGSSLSFSYDGILPTAVGWSGPVSGSVGVTYDNNFWVTQQTVNGGNAVSFGYDNDGLLTSAGSLSVARDAQNGLITGSTLGSFATRWTYSSFGELASDTARFDTTVLYRNSYTRDDLGRITAKEELIDGVTANYTFAYDSIGRLELVTRNGSPVESYAYDPNGNRLSFTGPGGTLAGSYDDQDRLLTYGDASYSYTAHGELASRTTPAGTTTYDYDVLGNLRSVTLPGGTEIEYVIDGQSRRVGKRVNGVLMQGFLYQDQLNPVAELDGTGQVVSRFVYGTRAHVPDYMVKGGVTYRLVTDHLGSVRLVVDVSSGAVAQRIDYDAFGRVTQDSNPGFQPFGFAGGIYDTHTGLVRFGARDYDAFTGRWTAKDPIGLAGGFNVYEYAGSNPVIAIDPTGLCPEKCDFSDRFRYNLSETNRFFFSDITRLTRTGIGVVTASATAKRIGGVTMLEFVRTLPGGYPALGGLAGTAGAMVINTAVNAILVATALETGIIIGSALDAAFCALLGGT